MFEYITFGELIKYICIAILMTTLIIDFIVLKVKNVNRKDKSKDKNKNVK